MNSIRESRLRKAIVDAARQAYEKELVWANSGNISCRLSETEMLITASNAFLGKLNENDLIKLDFTKKEANYEKKPSIEFRIHGNIYKTRENTRAVFHSQPFFTTLVACTDMELNPNLFPESVVYLEKIRRIPYHHPGSKALANVVLEGAMNCDVLILSNHGAVCIGGSLEDVLLKTETLEILCRMAVYSRCMNVDLNFLSDDVAGSFLEHLEEIKQKRRYP